MITDGFRVGNGLKQADGLATNLFNVALKYVIRLLSVKVTHSHSLPGATTRAGSWLTQ